jgi:Uma2 family endonuclease
MYYRQGWTFWCYFLRSAIFCQSAYRVQEYAIVQHILTVKLGLLINPQGKQIEVYRPGQEEVVLESPSSIDCGEVMPGFVMSLSRIW